MTKRPSRRACSVIIRIGRDFEAAVVHAARRPGAERCAPPLGDPAARMRVERSGYVQAIDIETLAKAAECRGSEIELSFRPGHHLLRGADLALVRPASALDDEFRAAITASVVIGSERTPIQDPEFSVRQLVEIALRALSPGINDAYTAVAVIDRLAAAFAVMSECGETARVFADAGGTARLRIPFPDFEGVVSATLDPLRQNAENNPTVLIRLLDVTGELAALAGDAGRRETLARHGRLIVEAGRRSFREPCDVKALEARGEWCMRAED